MLNLLLWVLLIMFILSNLGRVREELRKSLQRNTELEDRVRKLEDEIEMLALDVRFYRQQWQD